MRKLQINRGEQKISADDFINQAQVSCANDGTEPKQEEVKTTKKRAKIPRRSVLITLNNDLYGIIKAESLKIGTSFSRMVCDIILRGYEINAPKALKYAKFGVQKEVYISNADRLKIEVLIEKKRVESGVPDKGTCFMMLLKEKIEWVE